MEGVAALATAAPPLAGQRSVTRARRPQACPFPRPSEMQPLFRSEKLQMPEGLRSTLLRERISARGVRAFTLARVEVSARPAASDFFVLKFARKRGHTRCI